MAQFLFKRSGTADKRPDPAQMALGEVDLNYNATSGGLFYKDSGGSVVKVGPAQVGTDAPNSTPAGSAGNSLGEFWYNTGDGLLYVWDGASWAATSAGIGLASPTVPGAVYGLTEDTSLNVALGKGSGSNITTGTCNVALGPNVAVASATGDCQLAIGFSATDNWITGDATKAIKPGAGIIDCADSTGTAGQVLMSDGSNAICWGTPAAASPATPLTFGTVLGFTNDASFNTALGEGAFLGCSTATGERNTFIGAYGGASVLTSASYNSGVGQGIFGALTSGSYNSAFGDPGTLGFLTTGNNNSAFGAGALSCLTTGGINVGVGACAGCNITTGSCNVALGPNVQVASVTGDCQLAIGFSATANWLTGNSTKAIKPGAGIIDCADSTGTAGQLLSSTGANALEWTTPNYISPTALNASSAGALIVNGCDYGGGVCVTSILPGPSIPGQILTNAYNSGDPGYLAGQGYLNWCTPDFISQSSFSPGALVVGCTPGSTGGICTVGSIVNANNPGVAVGYYQGVTVTTCSGSGSGAVATVNVINGGYFPIFDSVEITQPGTGYALANTVGFEICGTTVTTQAQVCSLNQSTICKAGYLSVGTNGQVLTADSSCALGVKWAAAGGGGGSAATPTAAGIVLGTTTASNTGIGCNALNVTLTGTDNVAAGLCALFAVTGGLGNTAAGNFAAAGTTTGCYNVAMGLSALRTNSIGTRNVAIGENAGRGNTTGCFNVAVGSGALCATTSATDNTAVGYQALFSNTTSVGNTALGSLALTASTGISNTGVGLNALRGITTGQCNTALGANAACTSTSGDSNVSIGAGVQLPVITGSCQLAIGFGANYWLTGCSTKAIRPGAGIVDCAGSCGTNGQILASNGANAVCWVSVSGVSAATPAVSGSVLGCTVANLTALGCNAGVASTGAGNVAIGNSALCTNTTSTCSTAIGHQSLLVSTGCQNVGVGALALCALATGNDNVAIGTGSGLNLTSGILNVAIGSGVQFASATGSCQLALGFSPTDNWLTGDSTKAIKPGAGIIDCANVCGAEGQVLSSTGSNGVVWATVPQPWARYAAYKETVTNGTKICVIGWPSEESTTWSGQMSLSTTYDDGSGYWVPGSSAIIMINGFMGGGTNIIQTFGTGSGTFAVEGVAYGSQSDVTVTFTPSLNADRMNFYIGYMDLSFTGYPSFGLLTTNVTQFTPPAPVI